MRILFLAHRIPFPPNKGDKIRSYHEVRGLAARGHEVHLLAFADDPNDRDPKYRDELLAIGCASVGIEPLDRRTANARALLALAGARPLSLAFFSSAAMRRRVASVTAAAPPDAVVACSSSIAQYVPGALAPHAVVDLVDVDSEKWRDYAERSSPPRSWVYAEESRRLSRYEHEITRMFAATMVTTERERADLLRAGGPDLDPARVHVLANGVDVEYFRPGAVSPADVGFGPVIAFTGAMDYFANVDAVDYFAREVLPLVRTQVPDARFVVVGSNPTRDVMRLATLPGVIVTGTVPDVRPYLAAATVVVAPLRIARGVQNKILEAMAMERAVVATPTAARGVSADAGRDLLIADGADAWRDSILRLLRDPDARCAFGRAARRFVEDERQWCKTVDRLSELLISLQTHRHRRSDAAYR